MSNATPRRSLLAAKRIANLRHTSWRNPYVTDGLIAMWDGEWNVGGGMHEDNATGWTNLVTGEKCDLVNSTGSFDSNKFKSGAGGGVNIGTYSNICSMEIVAARFGGYYTIATPDALATDRTVSSMNMIYVEGVGYVPNRANAGNRVSFEDYTKPHTVSFVRDNVTDNYVTTYGDGIISSGALHNDYWVVSKGYIAYSMIWEDGAIWIATICVYIPDHCQRPR